MDTYVVGVLAAWVVACGYLAAGGVLYVNARSRRGILPFGLFWAGVGGYVLLEAVWATAYAWGVAPFGLALAVLHGKILLICAGFAGLVAYLLLIYTGSTRAVAAAGVYYAFAFALTEVTYALRDPVGQRAATWGMQLEYATPDVEPWWTLMLAALTLPPILAALAYGALLRHAEGPQRLRVALVSASLAAFFVPSLLAWRAGSWPWWGAAEKALGVVAALGMLAAYGATRRGADAAWSTRRSARRAEAAVLADARIRELV